MVIKQTFIEWELNIADSMEKETIYWTTKDGIKIDVDKMDLTHLRNTLKMIIRTYNAAKTIEPVKAHKFELHGEIAQQFVEEQIEAEYGDLDYYDYQSIM